MSIPITPHISAGVIGVSAAIPANFLESLELQGEILRCEVEPDLAKLSGKSIALFLINAQIGIPPNLVAYWDCARELQLPRLILVAGLTDGEIDFDDIVMIANRILDPVVTPFLVLHAENGRPNGLINIATSQTFNYSTAPITITAADPDLITLVSEFAAEYREQLEEFGEAGFADGLLFPCIPFIPELQIGIAEAQSYITLIPKL